MQVLAVVAHACLSDASLDHGLHMVPNCLQLLNTEQAWQRIQVVTTLHGLDFIVICGVCTLPGCLAQRPVRPPNEPTQRNVKLLKSRKYHNINPRLLPVKKAPTFSAPTRLTALRFSLPSHVKLGSMCGATVTPNTAPAFG